MPLISLVVPTYRRRDYLADALASVVGQTFRDFEVLVCDNAASDTTAALVEGLGDDRFSYIARPVNIGMVANVYDGLRRARGELVMKLDDDDVLEPDFLETLSAPMVADRAITVSVSDFSLIDADGRPLPERQAELVRLTGRDRTPEGYVRPFTAFVARGSFNMVAALLRASALDWDTISEQASTSYDLHLLLTAAQDAAPAHFTPRPLMRYRQHAASDTVTQPSRQSTGAMFALEHAMHSGRHADVEVLRHSMRYAGLALCRALLREGKVAEARAALARAGLTGVDEEALRLWGLARTPAGVASRVAVRRARRQQRAREQRESD